MADNKSYFSSLMLTTIISKGQLLFFRLHGSDSLLKSLERFILVFSSATVFARLDGLELDIGTDAGTSSPLKCKIF